MLCALLFIFIIRVFVCICSSNQPNNQQNMNAALGFYNQALALAAQQKNTQAIASYKKALELYPEFPPALNNIGNLLANVPASHRKDEEIISYFALAAKYAKQQQDLLTYANAQNNLGWFKRLTAGKNFKLIFEAIEHYKLAVAQMPHHIDAMYNMGSAYNSMGHYDKAQKIYTQVLLLNPNHTGAHMDMGNIYFQRGKLDEAVYHQDVIIDVATQTRDIVAAYNNKGQFLKDGSYVREALAAHEKALELSPLNPTTIVNVITARRQLCDWFDSENIHGKLFKLVQNQISSRVAAPSLQPYDSTLLPISSSFRKAIAMASSLQWNKISRFPTRNGIYKRKKVLKIGYLSYDFRNHPMGHLTVGPIELHNRSEYRIHGYSYGKNDNSEWRMRISKSCNSFTDICESSVVDGARKIFEDQLDILVDLMAHTRGTRIGLTALKPCGVIVNYLGFPGTMGSTFTDYIIVDRFVVPVENAKSTFTEKMVYLPFSYQANDYDFHIKIRPLAFSKSDDASNLLKNYHNYDLPSLSKNYKKPIIFCNMNTINKMEPKSFSIWMSILHRVPNSILWLLKPSKPLDRIIMKTFARQAAAHGIHPSRLIFAKRLSKRAHLERLGQADVFLDSLIYGAHSTGSDALWMHVPIVTVCGEGFPARVAASLLNNVGLSELITYSLKEFEDLAVHLAFNIHLRKNIRRRLMVGALYYPLFNTPETTQYLERSYDAIYEIKILSVNKLIKKVYDNSRLVHIVINPTEITNYASQKSIESRDQYCVGKVLQVHQAGKLAEAEDGYFRILQLGSNNSDVWHLLGLIKYKQRKYDEAESLMLKAISLRNDVSFYHSNLGEVYRAKGMIDQARHQFELAMYIDPWDYSAFKNYGLMLEYEKLYNVFVTFFQTFAGKALHRATLEERERHYLQYSHALSETKNPNVAIDVLNLHVLKENPRFFKVWYNLAAIYNSIGKYDEASLISLRTVENENIKDFNEKGIHIPTVKRPPNKVVIAIYCNEYGQTWWEKWGPSSLLKGIGGSEEAVIFLSKELQALGYWVEVYGNPSDSEIGQHPSGVVWYPYYAYNTRKPADVFVAWRYSISIQLGLKSKQRFVWLHDMPSQATFSRTVVSRLDGIFCLSKFQISHLPKSAQKKTIQISNALDAKYFADGENRNDQFVYGSAPNRGLYLLLSNWRHIRAQLPTATLLVYYGFTPAFVSYGKQNIKDYEVWQQEIEMLLKQDGVTYKGLVDHLTLANGLASSGFYLYPSVYPETGCISILKAMAMGCIPITSKYHNSALPELTGNYDLGPRPMANSTDTQWVELWVESVVNAVSRDDLDAFRSRMKQDIRERFAWSNIAKKWQNEFIMTEK